MLGISSWSLESREENMKSCSVSPFYCLNWVPGNCCQLLLPLLTTSYHCHCQSKTLHHNMNLSVWQQPKQCPVSWLFEIWFVTQLGRPCSWDPRLHWGIVMGLICLWEHTAGPQVKNPLLGWWEIKEKVAECWKSIDQELHPGLALVVSMIFFLISSSLTARLVNSLKAQDTGHPWQELVGPRATPYCHSPLVTLPITAQLRSVSATDLSWTCAQMIVERTLLPDVATGWTVLWLSHQL